MVTGLYGCLDDSIYNPQLKTECSCYSKDDETTSLTAKLFAVIAKHCQQDKVASIVSKVEALLKKEKGTCKHEYDFSRFSDIECYCLDRLSEIRLINVISPTPSAFVTIGVFIGFLSRLAYGDNDRKNDGRYFKRFVKRFMRGYPPERMYKMFRCGIVHALSFYPTVDGGRSAGAPPRKRYPWVLITHDNGYKNLSRQPIACHNVTILQAQSLIDDLQSVIKVMFKRKDVQKNSVAFVAWQPPIVGDLKRKEDDGQLSGYAVRRKKR